MTPVIERPPALELDDQAPTHGLFVVWFDTACGHSTPDWWWEEPGPQQLAAALQDAADMRRDGWITQVWPEHLNPRPDGRWDNP